MDYIKTSYFFSLLVQFIALIIQHFGLELNVTPEHSPLKYALKLEYYVSIIEFIVYIWIGTILSKINEITPRRYIDWVITTSILLVTTRILFIYEKKVP